MKHLALLVALCAAPAIAGERYLGRIISAAGADTSNASTATPFFIPSDAKITIFCNAAAYVITDTRSAAATDGTNGLPVTANEKFPTSTGTQIKVVSATAANGGAIVRIAGAAAVTCWVYERRGNE